MVRVAVGGINHETCTYADATTGQTNLDSFRTLRGPEILAAFEGASTSVKGLLDGCAGHDFEVVPTFWAQAEPGGTISASAWVTLRDELLASVAAAMADGGDLDCVLLDLHGAGVADGIEDIEGDLGSQLRELVGTGVMLGCTLDLHGNISEQMAQSFDLMLGCHLYPHTDFEERAAELVQLVAAKLLQKVEAEVEAKAQAQQQKQQPAHGFSSRPFLTHIEHLPLMLPPQPTASGLGPAHAMNALCAELEQQHAAAGLLDVTVFHGFHLADIANTAVHVVATVSLSVPDEEHQHRQQELAKECAVAVGKWIWARREQVYTCTRIFTSSSFCVQCLLALSKSSKLRVVCLLCRQFIPPLRSSAEAVADAMDAIVETNASQCKVQAQEQAQPVVINEASDNCGGGAPGDATHLLRQIVESAAPKLPYGSCAFSGLVDPAAATRAHAAGLGATLMQLELGGRADPSTGGAPLVVGQAHVRALSDGRYTLTEWAPGLKVDYGLSCRLVLEPHGVELVVVSDTQQTLDAGLLRMHGIEPLRHKLVGLKSEAHFRAGFSHLASSIFTADDPGLTTARVESFARTRKTRKLWPQDMDASYEFADAEAEPAEAVVARARL